MTLSANLTLSFLTSGSFWINVGVLVAIYGLFAVGLQLTIGTTGQLNLGQTGFMAIAAYAMATLVVRAHLELWVAMAIGLVVAMLSAAVVGVVTLRLRSDYFAITTLAFSEIVRYVADNWYAVTGGSQGLFGYADEWQNASQQIADTIGFGSSGGTAFLFPLLLAAWAAFLAVSLGTWALSRTPWGRVLRAIRDDEDVVATLGKNPLRFKVQALMLSAALAGLAGYALALNLSILAPASFDSIFLVFGVTIVVLGGLGSYAGLVVGAVLLMFLLQATLSIGLPLADDKVASLRYVIVGVVLILLMAWRPQGVFGKRQELGIHGIR